MASLELKRAPDAPPRMAARSAPGPVPLTLVTLDVPDAGPLRVVVAARDPLVRGALAHRLGGGDAREAVPPGALLAAADVALWDVGFGAPAPRDFADAFPEGRLPVLALVPDADAAPAAWHAGARGVLPRNAAPDAIASALFALARGLVAFDATLAHALLVPRAGDAAPGADALTPRERAVLALVAEGLPNKLVADRLGVAERTVKFHLASVFAKLDAHSRTEAVARGARLGLIAL